MSGIYFKADNTYGGQVRFEEDRGLVLTPRGSKEVELVALADIQRISAVEKPAWFKLMNSPLAAFIGGFLLGGFGGMVTGSDLGFFGSGLSLGGAFGILAFIMPQFLANQLLSVEAQGRPAFRIQMPKKFVKQVQTQHPRWFA